ncbi:MAG: sulfotransferase family protein, partial [Terriglobia bacterium]
MQRPIIVLGMHRSGTSLVAELVGKWGAFGNDQFLPTDSRNPQGYWEYAPLVHFNRRLLASIGSQSFLPPSDQDTDALVGRASDPAWRNEASQLIAAMESGKRAWYWKDPRLSVMLPFWQKMWDDAVYVVTVREPLDTALSLKKRDNLPLSAAILLWQRYMTTILRCTETRPRRLFIQYERILSEPVEECRRLCGFLEEHCGADDTQPSGQRVDSMLKAVNPKLRSHANGGALFSSSEVTEEQKNLYKYLRSRGQSLDERFDPGAFNIYPGWRDYLRALVTLEQAREALRREEERRQQPLALKIRHK